MLDAGRPLRGKISFLGEVGLEIGKPHVVGWACVLDEFPRAVAQSHRSVLATMWGGPKEFASR